MRVLHVLTELDGGGVERLLHDYYMRMPRSVSFDFTVCVERIGILEQPLKDRGCRIFHISRLRGGLFKVIRQLSKIIKNGNYDIVHTHLDYLSVVALFVAWIYGVKVRIAHSHTAYAPESISIHLFRKVITPLTMLFSTDLFACGHEAGKWIWGNHDFYIMNNAINTQSFVFDKSVRDQIRKKLGVEDRFVVGNVARLSYQKNHEFLIKIFSEIKMLRPNAILLLIGRGELHEEIQKQVSDMGLSEEVKFLGVRNDVPLLLNALDVFVLPSRFEGLGIVFVEAQANGIASYGSEKVVPYEVKFSEAMHFLPLSFTAKEWAESICNNGTQRIQDGTELVRKHGYDMDTEAKRLVEKYHSLLIRRDKK